MSYVFSSQNIDSVFSHLALYLPMHVFSRAHEKKEKERKKKL